MKKRIKRFISTLSAVLAISSVLSIFSFAAFNPPDGQDSSAYLSDYGVALVATSGGNMNCVADVSAVVNATMIGATDVYFYEGSSASGTFSQVAHYNYLDYPNMVGSGYVYFGTAATYPGTVGKYYFARVYFYAGDSTGGATRHLDSNIVKARA